MCHTTGRARGAAASAVLLVALLGWTSPLSGQEVATPGGVTVAGVEQGLRLYHTKGACAPCHGELGVGTAEGPPLIAGQWKLGPGTMEWLTHMTRHAGWGAAARSGDPQPMRGPTVLDSAEVRAVAAYVWSISRARAVGTNRP